MGDSRPGSSVYPRIVIVSPCRDEAATLERTVASMEAQSLQPIRWVVVDDGSTDDTPELLARAAKRIPWLHIVRRENRGFRSG
jgi:biofilm PGA synthesis N-glycosyltransferase PgaC